MQLLFLAAMLAADDTLAGSTPSLSSPTATAYSVALKWKDPSSSEQSWMVERSTTSGGNFVVIATLSSNRTSYVDSSVVPNQTYYYRVAYLTSGGSRKYSDTARTKTKSDKTAPVSDITSPSSGNLVAGGLNLAATVTDQGGVASVNFYLDDALIGISTNPPYSQNLNTKLVVDGIHTVKVVAFDLAGNQGGSPSVTFTTDNTPPSVPVPTATPNSTSRINLSWPDSIDSGAAGLSRYNIYLNGVYISSTPNPGYSLEGLLPETQYCFTVEAVDILGNASVPSVLTCATTPAAPVPDTNAPSTPTGLTATITNCHRVTLSWNESFDTGTGVSHYLVRKNGTPWQTIQAPSTSIADNDVTGGTTYYYSVNAVDGAGNESTYVRVAVTLPACPDTIAPTTPTGLAGQVFDCQSVSLSWNTSSDDGGAGLKGYNIYRNGTWLKQILAPATATTDGTVTETNTYGYAISSVDNSGNESQRSFVASVTIPSCPDLTAPSLVTNLVAVPGGCTTVLISWNASTDAGGSGLMGYKLYRDGQFLKTVPAPTTNTTDASVPASTTCTYAVVSLDNAGNSSPSSPTIAATTPACPDTIPPMAPGSATATSTDCGRVELSWTASSDAASGLRDYRIYRNGLPLQTLPASATAYSDTTVVASMAYTYSVVASDNANNSATSLDITVTTPACPDTNAPTVPGSVTARAISCGRIELAWTASSDAASGLRDYRIYRNGLPLQTLPASATAYSDTTVVASMAYTYSVVASDNANNSATSLDITVTTPACPDTNAPTVPLSGRFVAVTNIGTADGEYAMCVAMDRNGNSFIGGSAAGVPFLCKLSPAKVALWSLSLANAGSIQSIAVDAQGDVIFTGYFYAAVNFGGGLVSSIGGYDIFVVKYSSDGHFVWAKRYGSNNAADWAGDEAGLGIAVDSKGNIGVSGGYFGGADFDKQILGRVGVKEGFLLLLNPQGALVWINTLSNSTPTTVAFDPQDNLVVGGNFSGTVNMGGNTLVSAGSTDIFLAKFSPAGRHIWSKRTGGFSSDTINALAVDSSGDVVATGTYRLRANFDGTLFNGFGDEDIFIAKYDGASGALRWAKQFGTELSEFGYGIATDAARNITVVGRFGTPIDLGGGLLDSGLGNNVFIAKFSPDGLHIWSKSIGSGREDAHGVVTDSRSHIFVAGRFSYTVNFGGGPVTTTGNSIMPDLFLLELEP